MDSRVIYQVQVQVAPEAERSWDVWNTREHVPAVLRQAGFVRAVKYRTEPADGSGWVEYLVHYEVASRAALDSYLAGDDVVRLRREHEERFGEVTRLSRRILVPAAEVAREG